MIVHPALPLLIAALLQGLLRPRWRGPVAFFGAVAALAAVLRLPADARLHASLLGRELLLVHGDALGQVFALVFAGMACLGTLYALHVKRATEQAATLLYSAAAQGVVLAGDWITLFLGWELMAVASAAVVWHGRRERTPAAGLRYVLVHLASGALLFSGILLLHADGLTTVGPVPAGAAFWLLLAGVAINAAVPPLHAWLTDAYPEASVTGSVFLSAFTTKAAVYVLIRAFPGTEVLIGAGVAMALYGVVFAVLENDIRRLLAYHIVSQVGYMVAAVGMGTPLALNGAVAHAFCHILYKSLLFMGTGAVIQATGRHHLTALGGLAPRMKTVVVLYMVGAFSISGFPLFNGFVSKSMIVTAAAEGGWPLAELLLLLASVGTFLHTGLKLPWFTFFGSSSGSGAGVNPPPVRSLPPNMLAAMAAGAVLCMGLGLFPGSLYARLPFAAGYEPYTLDHVVSAVQLLLGTGVAFVLLLPKLAGEATISLDTDWLYRRPLRAFVAWLTRVAAGGGQRLQAAGRGLVAGLGAFATNPPEAAALLAARLRGEAWVGRAPFDPDGARPPISTTLLWVMASLLAVILGLGRTS